MAKKRPLNTRRKLHRLRLRRLREEKDVQVEHKKKERRLAYKGRAVDRIMVGCTEFGVPVMSE